MKLFNLRCYATGDTRLLAHDNKTKEEFEKDVRESTRALCKKMLDADPENLVGDTLDRNFEEVCNDSKTLVISNTEQLFWALSEYMTWNLGYYHPSLAELNLDGSPGAPEWHSWLGEEMLQKVNAKVDALKDSHAQLY